MGCLPKGFEFDTSKPSQCFDSVLGGVGNPGIKICFLMFLDHFNPKYAGIGQQSWIWPLKGC